MPPSTLTRTNASIAQPRRPLLGLLRRLALWHAVLQERQRLSQLDDAALKDLGLTPQEVRRETRRWPWSVDTIRLG